MATIVTRAGKGSALTFAEADANFTNLNTELGTAVKSNTAGITGADVVTNIVSLTQAEYDAITTPNASTLYVITD